MTTGPTSDTWRSRAACRGSADPSVWVPDRDVHTTPPALARICARCPVWPECLEHGMATSEMRDDLGIYGGLTSRQRRTLHRRILRTSTAA